MNADQARKKTAAGVKAKEKTKAAEQELHRRMDEKMWASARARSQVFLREVFDEITTVANEGGNRTLYTVGDEFNDNSDFNSKVTHVIAEALRQDGYTVEVTGQGVQSKSKLDYEYTVCYLEIKW